MAVDFVENPSVNEVKDLRFLILSSGSDQEIISVLQELQSSLLGTLGRISVHSPHPRRC